MNGFYSNLFFWTGSTRLSGSFFDFITFLTKVMKPNPLRGTRILPLSNFSYHLIKLANQNLPKFGGKTASFRQQADEVFTVSSPPASPDRLAMAGSWKP